MKKKLKGWEFDFLFFLKKRSPAAPFFFREKHVLVWLQQGKEFYLSVSAYENIFHNKSNSTYLI
jgi:hypothetical protein